MNSGSAKTLTINITDQALGTEYFPFGSTYLNNGSIFVTANTGLTFTLEACNDDNELIWRDVTPDLFGVATLAPGNYFFDTTIAAKNLRIAALATVIPNKGNIYWFMTKNGGR